jgi:hypothetical protein
MLDIAKYQPVVSLEDINEELEKLNTSLESFEKELNIIYDVGVESITDKMKKTFAGKINSLVNNFNAVDKILDIKFKKDLDRLIKDNDELKKSDDESEKNRKNNIMIESKEIGTEKIILVLGLLKLSKNSSNDVNVIPRVLSYITKEIKATIDGDTSSYGDYLEEKEKMGNDRYKSKPEFSVGNKTNLERSNLLLKLCKDSYLINKINIDLINKSKEKINNLEDVNKIKETVTLLKILHDLSIYFTKTIFDIALLKQ